MIPAITRHLFGIPATRRNQTMVRWKLRRFLNLCTAVVGALFLAACIAALAMLAFAF